MTGNPWAGEVCLTIDGKPRKMKLTLGVLAELEAELRAGSLIELVERFERGGFSAHELLLLLGAGLRGGGEDVTRETLAAAEIDGGPMAAARAGGRLLALAFGPVDRDAA